MLILTPEAVRAVVDVVVTQEPSGAAGLRIAPGPPSAADRTWDYAVAREPFEGDLVIEAGPARVFVDPDAAQRLEQGCWTRTSTTTRSRRVSSSAPADVRRASA